jgi:hypothetical protein
LGESQKGREAGRETRRGTGRAVEGERRWGWQKEWKRGIDIKIGMQI